MGESPEAHSLGAPPCGMTSSEVSVKRLKRRSPDLRRSERVRVPLAAGLRAKSATALSRKPAQGSGFRVKGLGFRGEPCLVLSVWGLVLSVWGSGFGVHGFEFKRFTVKGLGFKV